MAEPTPTFRTAQRLQKKMDAVAALPVRQQLLFAASCARIALPHWLAFAPHDDRPLKAILAVEAVALGLEKPDAAKMAAFDARQSANYVSNQLSTTPAYRQAFFAASSAAHSANCAAQAALTTSKIRHSLNLTYATYAAVAAVAASGVKPVQDAYDNAHNDGKIFPDLWKTPDAVALARNADPTLAPILADALEEAGCDDRNVLDRLRSDRALLSDWVFQGLIPELYNPHET